MTLCGFKYADARILFQNGWMIVQVQAFPFLTVSWVMRSLVEIHAGRAAFEALTVLKWQCGALVC